MNRRALPRHREEGFRDLGAALGRVAQLSQLLALSRILGILFEHDRPADHHRERIVELMRDAGQKGSERRHLFALMERLALAGHFRFGLTLHGQIADIGDEKTPPGMFDFGERELDRDRGIRSH